jgi:hypothetical protein
MFKAHKRNVDYSRGMKERHCGKSFEDDTGYCKHFVEPPSQSIGDLGTCARVQGEISRVFWCRLFARANTK